MNVSHDEGDNFDGFGEAPTQMFSASKSLLRMPFEGREDT